jgi:HAD superfamily hydrolase (TIGR01509 family)
VADRPDLVIFDCDGVLVDTERLAIRLEVELLAELGWEITEAEIVERFVGISDGAMQRAIVEHTGRPLPDGWEESVRPRYRSAYAAELVPVPGVVDVLDRLDAEGIPTCVASSGTHELMAFTLGLTGLADRFSDRIFSATEVERGKPAPDLFLHSASNMGVEPSRCTVIEDSRPGVDGAVAAGMRVLAYGGGVTPPARLERDGAEVFRRMAEVPAMLGLR